MNLAPIVLFVYNRTDHLSSLINSLKKNKLFDESKLIIFSDGPKNNNDKTSIQNIRFFIKKELNSFKYELISRPKNYGLSKNIINGLNEVFKKYAKAIILEDDLELSPFFLNYMNDALNIYENNDNVASISGYMYPIDKLNFSNNYFFLPVVESWGWATWRRAWKHFEGDSKKLKNSIDCKNLQTEFNFDNGISYYKMLEENIKGKNDSWAIRWYASVFLNNMINLYPDESFVKNNGLDNSGSNCNYTSVYDSKLRKEYSDFKKVKSNLNKSDIKVLKNFFKKIKYKRYYQNLINKINFFK